MPGYMPNIFKSLAALSFIPMLLAPMSAQAQDATTAGQSQLEADKAAGLAAREAEKEAGEVMMACVSRAYGRVEVDL